MKALSSAPAKARAPAGDPAAAAKRSLAQALVTSLGERIRRGQLAPGARLPTEAAVMHEFGVSRTVVREALSRLQAAGLVRTRHGVGSFVAAAADARAFRIGEDQLATLQDVIAVLELRIGVETEAAGLAAQRRSDADLAAMRRSLGAFARAVDAGLDAVDADYDFHLQVARATGNPHFHELLASLGMKIIPRARLAPPPARGARAGAEPGAGQLAYLRRVHAEHESILDAIAARDAEAARAAMRTHLSNSRERRRRVAEAAAAAAATAAAAARRPAVRRVVR